MQVVHTGNTLKDTTVLQKGCQYTEWTFLSSQTLMSYQMTLQIFGINTVFWLNQGTCKEQSFYSVPEHDALITNKITHNLRTAKPDLLKLSPNRVFYKSHLKRKVSFKILLLQSLIHFPQNLPTPLKFGFSLQEYVTWNLPSPERTVKPT